MRGHLDRTPLGSGHVNHAFAADVTSYPSISSEISPHDRLTSNLGSSPAKDHAEHRTDVEIRCTYPRCKYEHTFRRQYELDRHVSAKHEIEKRFWCCAAGCIKGNSAPAFSRSDKLTDHIRAMHSRPDARFDCPLLGCQNQDTLYLEELPAHIERAHNGRGLHARSIVNAAGKRTCPLWDCRKHVAFLQFVPHLSTHTLEELASVSMELLDQGYILTNTDIALRCLVDTCSYVSSSHHTIIEHIKTQHAEDTLGRDLKVKLLRQCPSLAAEQMFDYLLVVRATTTST